MITGRGGADLPKGRGGENLVRARDGRRDEAKCGRGTDIAVVDPVDAVADWETLRR